MEEWDSLDTSLLHPQVRTVASASFWPPTSVYLASGDCCGKCVNPLHSSTRLSCLANTNLSRLSSCLSSPPLYLKPSKRLLTLSFSSLDECTDSLRSDSCCDCRGLSSRGACPVPPFCWRGLVLVLLRLLLHLAFLRPLDYNDASDLLPLTSGWCSFEACDSYFDGRRCLGRKSLRLTLCGSHRSLVYNPEPLQSQ